MSRADHPISPEQLLANIGWVRMLVRDLVEDQALVDDVVQETLLAALETSSQIPGELRKWLGGVARRLVAQETVPSRVTAQVNNVSWGYQHHTGRLFVQDHPLH